MRERVTWHIPPGGTRRFCQPPRATPHRGPKTRGCPPRTVPIPFPYGRRLRCSPGGGERSRTDDALSEFALVSRRPNTASESPVVCSPQRRRRQWPSSLRGEKRVPIDSRNEKFAGDGLHRSGSRRQAAQVTFSVRFKFKPRPPTHKRFARAFRRPLTPHFLRRATSALHRRRITSGGGHEPSSDHERTVTHDIPHDERLTQTHALQHTTVASEHPFASTSVTTSLTLEAALRVAPTTSPRTPSLATVDGGSELLASTRYPPRMYWAGDDGDGGERERAWRKNTGANVEKVRGLY